MTVNQLDDRQEQLLSLHGQWLRVNTGSPLTPKALKKDKEQEIPAKTLNTC